MSSELLGSAQNVLKGNLGGAWDITNGYQDAYTDLGIARRFGGAAAAYSLRDIGAMNGRVVRVRRDTGGGAGDDDEEDFTANQIASGALEDFVGSGNDGFVSIWYDQSGNGNNATQDTANEQPYIVQNGGLVTDTNSLPALQWVWNSTSDGRYLKINGDTGIDVTAAVCVLNTPSAASGSEDYRSLFGKQAENLQFLRQQQANRRFFLAKPTFTTGQYNGNTDLLDKSSIFSYNRSGSTNTIKLSSTTATTETVASNLNEAINFDRLGTRRNKADNHNGKWQEVILYNRDLGSDENEIITELSKDYAITLV